MKVQLIPLFLSGLALFLVASSGSERAFAQPGEIPGDDVYDEELWFDTIRTPTFDDLHFYSGLAMPIGSFAAAGGKNPGYAETGPLVGIDYAIYADSINHSPRWVSSLIFTRNGSDAGAVRSAINQRFELPTEAKVDVGPWYALTTMTGFEFRFPVSPVMRLGVAAQIGFGVGSSSEVTLSSDSASLVQRSNVAAAPAYGGAFTLTVNERLGFGLRFNSMKITYDLMTMELEGQAKAIFYEQQMDMLSLYVGYSL